MIKQMATIDQGDRLFQPIKYQMQNVFHGYWPWVYQGLYYRYKQDDTNRIGKDSKIWSNDLIRQTHLDIRRIKTVITIIDYESFD